MKKGRPKEQENWEGQASGFNGDVDESFCNGGLCGHKAGNCVSFCHPKRHNSLRAILSISILLERTVQSLWPLLLGGHVGWFLWKTLVKIWWPWQNNHCIVADHPIYGLHLVIYLSFMALCMDWVPALLSPHKLHQTGTKYRFLCLLTSLTLHFTAPDILNLFEYRDGHWVFLHKTWVFHACSFGVSFPNSHQ